MSVIETIKDSIKETMDEVKEEIKNQMETEEGEQKINPLWIAGGAALIGVTTYLGVKHFKKGDDKTAETQKQTKEDPKEAGIPNTWQMRWIRNGLNKMGLDVCPMKKEEEQTEVNEPEVVNEEDKK